MLALEAGVASAVLLGCDGLDKTSLQTFQALEIWRKISPRSKEEAPLVQEDLVGSQEAEDEIRGRLDQVET